MACFHRVVKTGDVRVQAQHLAGLRGTDDVGHLRQRRRTDRQIDNVKRLTPRWRIESLTKFGSDQAATEALQEAETEVGVGIGG